MTKNVTDNGEVIGKLQKVGSKITTVIIHTNITESDLQVRTTVGF